VEAWDAIRDLADWRRDTGRLAARRKTQARRAFRQTFEARLLSQMTQSGVAAEALEEALNAVDAGAAPEPLAEAVAATLLKRLN